MRYSLPSEKTRDGKSNKAYRHDLSEVVRSLVDKGVSVRNPRSVEWKINYHYLQGVRHFFIESFKTGAVQATWESHEGQLQFRFEEVLDLYQKELGVLLDLDPSPYVKPRKRLEIDGIRKAAAAQVWLDHVTGPMDLTEILKQCGESVFQFGTVGIGVFNDPRVTLEEGAYISTIPPWQLLPIPNKPTRYADVVGLIRHRWVPYYEVRESMSDMKWPEKDNPRKELDERLDIRWVPIGDREPEHDGDPDAQGTGAIENFRGESSGLGADTGSQSDSQPYIEMIEVWLEDYTRKCDRRILQFGRWLGEDNDFSGERPENKPLAPIGIIRGMHSGGFWARPWLSDMVVFNNECERNWQNLFKNVQEFDQFGTTLYPLNQGIHQHHFESKNKPKAVGYEPDYMGGKFQIERLTPTNSGTLPMEIASAAVGMMERRASLGELMRGDVPGRLESAAALGVVHETSMISRKAFISSLNAGWSHMYRCLLQKGRLANTKVIQLKTVDHRLAGIAVTASGEITLDPNVLPHPDEIQVGMRSGQPRLRSQKQQEVLANFDRGLIPPHKLAWINHTQDLGLDLGMDSIVAEIERCMLHNLILFGDGKKPGTVTDPEFCNHQIWSEIILEFMSSDAYRLASDEVKGSFVARIQYHQQQVGGYPDQMPYPEEFGGGGSGAQLPPQMAKEMQGIQKKNAMADLQEALGASQGPTA